MKFPPQTFGDMSPVALSVIWDQLMLGVAIVDDKQRFVSANPAFCELTEYTESEILQLRLDDLMSPHDLGHMLKEMDEVDRGLREAHELVHKFHGRLSVDMPVRVMATKIHLESGDYSVFLVQAKREDRFEDQRWREMVDTLQKFNASDAPSDLVAKFIRENLGMVLGAIGVSLSAFAAAIYTLAQ
jgi:PAS domain S-box-containing protein